MAVIPAWTAGDEETFARLSDQMAGALVAFAKTGNPSQPDLEWPAWNSEEDPMMVWDHTSEVRNHHEDALFEALGTDGQAFPPMG